MGAWGPWSQATLASPLCFLTGNKLEKHSQKLERDFTPLIWQQKLYFHNYRLLIYESNFRCLRSSLPLADIRKELHHGLLSKLVSLQLPNIPIAVRWKTSLLQPFWNFSHGYWLPISVDVTLRNYSRHTLWILHIFIIAGIDIFTIHIYSIRHMKFSIVGALGSMSAPDLATTGNLLCKLLGLVILTRYSMELQVCTDVLGLQAAILLQAEQQYLKRICYIYWDSA